MKVSNDYSLGSHHRHKLRALMSPYRHLHITHDTPCISIVLNFSWDDCNNEEK